MQPSIQQVHLFLCLDPRISPGPVLQCLDLLRAKNWQKEIVLLCGSHWKNFVTEGQSILFFDKSDLAIDGVERILEQLDQFELTRVTQIGQLAWGRWIKAYLDQQGSLQQDLIVLQDKEISSIQLMNEICQELALDLAVPIGESPRSSTVFVDPYENATLSPKFLELFANPKKRFPEWLQIIARQEDYMQLGNLGLGDNLIDESESAMSLFNQNVLCFSDQSQLAVASRSYNVALFQCATDQSLFLQGDISINPEETIHVSELLNILTYWKTKRLRELAFQWYNMGIEIQLIELFHRRVIKRNLLNYSSDLHHCQQLVHNFVRQVGVFKPFQIVELIFNMRRRINNDPFSLSFSLKLLIMIVERMVASASCNERLFQRLGSDYHRIIIAESLVEGLLTYNGTQSLNIQKKLQEFLNFLIEIDFKNDEADLFIRTKES